MSWRQHTLMVCDDCGAQIIKRKLRPGPVLCGECAITRTRLAAEQMAAKSGPAWETWLRTAGPSGGATGPRKKE